MVSWVYTRQSKTMLYFCPIMLLHGGSWKIREQLSQTQRLQCGIKWWITRSSLLGPKKIFVKEGYWKGHGSLQVRKIQKQIFKMSIIPKNQQTNLFFAPHSSSGQKKQKQVCSSFFFFEELTACQFAFEFFWPSAPQFL